MDETLTINADAPDAPEIPTVEGTVIPPVKDAAPKRGPGRPKGSRNANTKPKTPTQTTANRPRRAANSKTAVIDAVTGLVEAVNIAVSLSPYKDDCLTPDESEMLSRALALEVESSDRVASWLTRAGSISAHVVLLQAVVMIAVPRLQRRGILPRRELTPEQMDQLRAILSTQPGTATGENAPAAAPAF